MNQIDPKELIVFDLDGTLAISKSVIDAEMAGLLCELLKKKKVAVVSGGGFSQFKANILDQFKNPEETILENLVLMPNTGTRMYTYRMNEWREEYAEKLTKEEKEKIIGALEAALEEAGIESPDLVYGPPIVEDRETQITFSDFGQGAPVEVKEKWDPDHSKRDLVLENLRKRIPEFDAHIGGMTSIDVTRGGVDKAYAIKKLEKHLKISIAKMIFIGDALFEGGNDYPAKSTGINCISVKDPEEAKKLIAGWL
jgi:phosphomannomutase